MERVVQRLAEERFISNTRKERCMKNHSDASVHQTFRISVDVEVSMSAEGEEKNSSQGEPYPQAFFTWLQAHPRMRQQLLRSIALNELKAARVALENEYGWGKVSEQQFLQAAITDLGPAAHAYFAEELEDGVVAYVLDDYKTAIKHFQIQEFDS